METQRTKEGGARGGRTTVSVRLENGGLIELAYAPAHHQTLLIRYERGVITAHQSLTLESGEALVPVPASNNLIKHQALLCMRLGAPP